MLVVVVFAFGLPLLSTNAHLKWII